MPRDPEQDATPAPVTVIIPAKDESDSLRELLPELRQAYPAYRILVVDDGSGDDTVAVCRDSGVDCVSHPYNKGNGAAVKTGLRASDSELVVLMDADRQHSPQDVQRLLTRLEEGYDMVVGARSFRGQASWLRGIGNAFYNRLASWMVGHPIPDLTSGFRAARRRRCVQFLPLLPNGFSYPATITMAFFRAGYSVCYEPIETGKRHGTSHLRPLRDGLRFLLIIFRIGTLYSPLKVFVPVSFAFFAVGAAYYLYTFLQFHRFTNMSALLVITSVLVFLIGLVSEQVTNLLYRDRDE